MLDYNNNMELNAMKREREPWSKTTNNKYGHCAAKLQTIDLAMSRKGGSILSDLELPPKPLTTIYGYVLQNY